MYRMSLIFAVAMILSLTSFAAFAEAPAAPAEAPAPSAEQSEEVTPAGDVTDGLETPFTQRRQLSCQASCQSQYTICCDGCDSWPYPGCYQDCRSSYYACLTGC